MRTVSSRWGLVLAVLGCGGPTDPAPGDDPPGEPVEIRLNVQALALFDTETFEITATLVDSDSRAVDGTVTWTTSDSTVVSVDGGTVTGIGRGDATIEAAHQGLRATVSVSVIERLGLEWPLDAVVNQDVYYTNYVDQRPQTGLIDYQCGSRTYDGHRGIDIAVTSFAVMDSGVTIVAAAPGRVVTATDGMFDRNRVWRGGGLGNHVEVAHRDGLLTRYGHMVNGSVAVAVGDSVYPGTPLGLVGSSGNSDGPHLHFEMRRDNLVLDPYAGPCSTTATQWRQPLPYQDALRFIDGGVVTWQPTLDQAKDGLPHLDTLVTSDPLAAFWVQLHNLRLGAESRWILRRPSGSIHGQFTWTHDQFFMLSYWWAWWTMPNGFPVTGTWRFEYFHDNQLLEEREFVVAVSTAAGSPAGAPPATVGGGGGGTGRGGPPGPFGAAARLDPSAPPFAMRPVREAPPLPPVFVRPYPLPLPQPNPSPPGRPR